MNLAKRQKIGNSLSDALSSFKSGIDECFPISSLQMLKNWNASLAKHTTTPLLARESVQGDLKTLLCHDMKGGYLEDRHINGSNTEDNFYFLHWTAIDIFVYFSHHLVTIPPCGWISAAHKNGTKILGTFITEWDDGKKVCETLLFNEDSVEEFTTQLVKIANYFSFDGWLINIENKLQSCQVSLLEKFVKVLTQKMHLSHQGSLVIWYDSVLESGELKWQNALNENNRIFFECCDGIFLNYNWTEESLKKSVEVAGDRKNDVFVGADVFGRGCPGGGGFSTNIAVSAARKFGLSAAIFAPGWTYECLDIKGFKENQFKFWNALQEFCPPRKFKTLPFYTSFCPGFGKKLYKNGKVLNNTPWFNVSLQHAQPIYFSNVCSKYGTISLCDEESFQGGGCICLKLDTDRKNMISVFKIFETSILISESLIVSYTFKTSADAEVSLIFNSVNNNVGQKYEHCMCNKLEYFGDVSRCILPESSDQLSLLNYKIGKNPAKIGGWIKRVYILSLSVFKNHIIEDICIKVSAPLNEKHTVLFGELEILPFYLPKIHLQYRDLVYGEGSGRCTLMWSYHPSIYFTDLFIIFGVKKMYICRTSQFYYNLEFSLTALEELEVLLSFESTSTDPIPDASLKIPLKPS